MHAFPRSLVAVLLDALVYCPRLAAAQALVAWQFVAPKAGGQPAVVKVKIPMKFAAQADAAAAPAKS
jgi:multisubunit Na+/H+ antiporter MnhE subunit